MTTDAADKRRLTSHRFTTRRMGLVAGVGILSLIVAACGNSSKTVSTPTTTTTPVAPATSAAPPTTGSPATTAAVPTTAAAPTTAAPTTAPVMHSGKVAVLYAGSLVELMTKSIDPGFHAATGYKVADFSAGTTDLVTDIKGKVQKGDVFIAASPTANAGLEGASNGNWLTWYAEFATSPLVIGYNPKSKFAAQFKTKPWYDVVTESGFKLGLTPPATDPKGVLAVQALDETATAKGLPALKAIGSDTSNQFPEETLVGRLQSGQLDAGFFYAAEAAASDIPTVKLTGTNLSAGYTITVLKNGANPAGAQAFVEYFLGSKAAAFFKKDGFDLITPPKLSGAGVPAGIKSVISGS
jgi:molybdate/tungstate transport system substrate-binding protein